MVSVQKSDATAIEALRSKGTKATLQRVAICRVALSSRKHPSTQEVHNEVKKIHPTVSLATEYKPLKFLEI